MTYQEITYTKPGDVRIGLDWIVIIIYQGIEPFEIYVLEDSGEVRTIFLIHVSLVPDKAVAILFAIFQLESLVRRDRQETIMSQIGKPSGDDL